MDNIADKPISWQALEQKKSLRGIKKYSFKFFDSPVVSLKEAEKEV